MKISVKSRYGLASMIYMAQSYENNELTNITRISDSLGISKIYLEQVFSLLKRANLVLSVKGPQGGYQLIKAPGEITLFEILSAIEFSLFEKTEETVTEKAPDIEIAMQRAAFTPFDEAVRNALESVTLDLLAEEARSQVNDEGYMFFI